MHSSRRLCVSLLICFSLFTATCQTSPLKQNSVSVDARPLAATLPAPTKVQYPSPIPPGPVRSLAQMPDGELLAGVGPVNGEETPAVWQLYRGRGGSWQRLTWPEEVVLQALHVPSLGSPIFAVPLSNALLGSGQPWGLLRSTDGGLSWHQILTGLDDPYVTDIALSPRFAEDQAMVAVTWYNGVYYSDSAGDKWRRLPYRHQIAPSGGANPYDLAVAVSPDFQGGTPQRPAANGLLVASFAHGIHIWSSTEQRWRTVSVTVPARLEDYEPTSAPLTAGDIAFSPDFAQDGILYVYSGYAGLFRSSDGGLTWQFAGRGLPTPVPPSNTFHLEVLSANIACVLLEDPPPEAEEESLAQLPRSKWPRNLYCTRDGGTSWRMLQPPPEVGEVSTFTARRDETGRMVLYLGGVQGGVFDYAIETLVWR